MSVMDQVPPRYYALVGSAAVCVIALVLVKSGWIEEVSLSTNPANPLARVVSRLPAKSPTHEFHNLMLRRLDILRRWIEMMERQNAEQHANG
jgi:hypothetical protein